MLTIVVTDAGSGIGRATAERFCKKGWRAIVTDVNEEAGEETVDQIAARGQTAVFGDPTQAPSRIGTTWPIGCAPTTESPDVVVNNADILIGGNCSWNGPAMIGAG